MSLQNFIEDPGDLKLLHPDYEQIAAVLDRFIKLYELVEDKTVVDNAIKNAFTFPALFLKTPTP